MELRKRHYEIRPEHRGWKLEIFEEGESMGGGFFHLTLGTRKKVLMRGMQPTNKARNGHRIEFGRAGA